MNLIIKQFLEDFPDKTEGYELARMAVIESHSSQMEDMVQWARELYKHIERLEESSD